MTAIAPHVPKYEKLEQLALLYPEVDASAIRTCLTVLRVASQLSASFDEHFARFGLSQGRFAVLMMLRHRPEGMTPAAIAQAAGVSRPTITGLLDGLARAKLVQRRADRTDHRSRIITLAPAAERLFRRMLPTHYRKHAAIMAGLSRRDRDQLIELMQRIEPRAGGGGAT